MRIAVRHSLLAESTLKFADKLYDGPAARYFNELLSTSVYSSSSLLVTDVLDAMERHFSTAALRLHAGSQAASLRICPDGSQIEAVKKFIAEWTECVAATDVNMRSKTFVVSEGLKTLLAQPVIPLAVGAATQTITSRNLLRA